MYVFVRPFACTKEPMLPLPMLLMCQ